MKVGPSPARARATASRVASYTASTSPPSTRTPGHPVADRLVRERRARGLRRERRRDRPLVVVAEEDRPARCMTPANVAPSWNGALRRRAVAEDAIATRSLALQPRAPREARPRAGRASRSARRSTRRCSPSGSTSPPDGRATTEDRRRRHPAQQPDRRLAVRSGRSSRDPRARTPSPPACASWFQKIAYVPMRPWRW